MSAVRGRNTPASSTSGLFDEAFADAGLLNKPRCTASMFRPVSADISGFGGGYGPGRAGGMARRSWQELFGFLSEMKEGR
jgi:hypothetical protein